MYVLKLVGYQRDFEFKATRHQARKFSVASEIYNLKHTFNITCTLNLRQSWGWARQTIPLFKHCLSISTITDGTANPWACALPLCINHCLLYKFTKRMKHFHPTSKKYFP